MKLHCPTPSPRLPGEGWGEGLPTGSVKRCGCAV